MNAAPAHAVSSLPDWRSRLLVTFLALAALVVVGRLFQLQFLDRAELAELANRQRRTTIVLPARPGDIVDRQGRLLAASVSTRSLFLAPDCIESPSDVAARVATALELDADDLLHRIEAAREKQFLWVKRRLNDDEVGRLRALELPDECWGFRREYLRRYPQGRLAAHILGLRDIDGRGRGGLEQKCDDLLRGTDGRRVALRDARGRVIELDDDSWVPPQNGNTVVLTLDSVVQLYAERELDRLMETWRPKSACAIVLDPQSCEVLALASRPAFNPDNFNARRTSPDTSARRGSPDPAETADRRSPQTLDDASPSRTRHGDLDPAAWKNTAVAAIYEPGSTFKPLVVAWALDKKLAALTDVFHCERGSYRMGRRILHDHHPYGDLTLEDVLVKSSNIGMAKLGERLTNDELYACAVAFGFGRRTGSELPGELPGLVHPLARWTSYSTGSVPMGQELACTPLQMAVAHAALASGGRLMNPRLIRGATDAVAMDFAELNTAPQPLVVSQAVGAEAARAVVTGPLVQVVQRGTGTRAQIPGYTVFGKTGTAQKLDPQGGYSSRRHVSSFVCGAPADHPRALVFVLADEPSLGTTDYGGAVAAPTAAAILKQTLTHLGVLPDAETPSDATPPERITTEQRSRAERREPRARQ